MPSNLLTLDRGFPTFTGEESPKQQITALHNYLFQLREGLQYSLQNLTVDNFNGAEWKNLQKNQKNEITEAVQKVYTAVAQVSSRLDSLTNRVAGLEQSTGRRLNDLESTVMGEGGLWEAVVELQDIVTGTDGILSKLNGLMEIVTTADDNSVSVGSDGQNLYLNGNVYINGVLYSPQSQGDSV